MNSLTVGWWMVFLSVLMWATTAKAMERIRVSADGQHFELSDSGRRFVVWGVNYDHDDRSRLLDEYWDREWETVEEDFSEIQTLGANCVRVHLQLGLAMSDARTVRLSYLERLRKLLQLAEDKKLYLNITGLACYHKANVPAWFDALNESQRWAAQATFWEAVAKTCSHSPAVFCYDLMNEPILPGKELEKEWLGGELGGMYFVQRLTLDLNGRTREEVASQWVSTMVKTIKLHDEQHLITVGEIPWVFVFGGGKPFFGGSLVGDPLDFSSVHFYPKKGQVDQALRALKAYEVGKPLLIEEMFPLECSSDELLEFVERSSDFADGWISFYWGKTAKQLRESKPNDVGAAITANWLDRYQSESTKWP
jgi:Cellulase (glycosyl hydrolase family 5)